MSDLTATIHTSEGDIEVELFDEKAPRTVEAFVDHATEAEDYDEASVGPGEGAWEDPESGEKRTTRCTTTSSSTASSRTS